MRPAYFKLRHVAVIACVLFLHGRAAMAADYYVATNGNDSRACTAARTSTSPKQSIGNAVGCLAPGDTLWVRGGTYYEMAASIPSGTSWSSPVRIRAYRSSEGATPETVWLNAPSSALFTVYLAWSQQYIEFDGINLDASQSQTGVAVKIEETSTGRAHHIRIKNAELNGRVTLAGMVPTVGGNEFINLRVHGGGTSDFDHSFYVQSSNNLIDSSEIWDFPGAGIHLYNDYGVALSGNVIRNNYVHNGRSTAGGQRHWGIILANGAQNTKVYNNLVTNIPNQGGVAAGIDVFSGYGAEIYNNTVYGSSSFGMLVQGGSGISILNNIFYGNGINMMNFAGETPVSSHNLLTDPAFVNAGGADFRLRGDSPAIDQGLSLGDIVSDLLGVARSGAPDLGAFEYGTGSCIPSGGGSSAPAPTAPVATSADGTRVPSASSIVDAAGATWTIGSGQRIQRDGVATRGVGSQILWYRSQLFVLGSDNRWWLWTGDTFVLYSASDPSGSSAQSTQAAAVGGSSASADGTRVPSAASIVDASQATWTLSNGVILRNGAATSGRGSQLLYSGGRVYAFGTDGNWWLWNGSGWQFYSASDPSGGAAVADAAPAGAGQRIPGVSSVTDSSGAVWTLVNGVVLRNGSDSGGRASQVLLYQGTLYAKGTDGNWWRWASNRWSYYSASDPTTV